jgi:hypothetical protein
MSTVHLIRSGKKFDVVVLARNGELLTRTPQGYERKQGCYKWMRAMRVAFTEGQSAPMFIVTFYDETSPVAVYKYMLHANGRPFLSSAVKRKRYVPKKKAAAKKSL